MITSLSDAEVFKCQQQSTIWQRADSPVTSREYLARLRKGGGGERESVAGEGRVRNFSEERRGGSNIDKDEKVGAEK